MFLGFGEIMARIAPPHGLRWRQSVPGSVDVTWGGGEANVCASLAMFGEDVRFVTALPKQPISEALVGTLRGLGVDTSQIVWREGRLGLYFVEVGSNQRGSTVLYDRSDSSVSLAGPDDYDFDAILSSVHHLHVTGITPAISEAACLANQSLAQAAKERGVTVSCDLNFRKKLWKWQLGTPPTELARRCMSELLPFVDLVVANEEDAANVLDIHATGADIERGQIDAAAYEQVAREITTRFANVSRVAITLRESISANHNNWGAMLFDAAEQKAFLAPLDTAGTYQPYEIRHIVDRVGAGDSFVAGLLHALESDEFAEPQKAIEFAVAASCLKHTVKGDFNYMTHDEVAALVAGASSGRVQR